MNFSNDGSSQLNTTFTTSGTTSPNAKLTDLSNYLLLTGGTLTGNLIGTTISCTSITGSGSGLSAINASNISSGTLGITYGGTGGTTGLTVLNASNISSGTSAISQGGTGVTTSLTVLNASYLSSGTLSTSQGGTGVTTGLTVLNASNVTTGTLSLSQGGTGVTTGLTVLNASNITSGTLSISGAGLSALNASNITTGTLSISGAGLSALNASNITSGTLGITYGGTGTTTGLTVLNASNISLGTLAVNHGGTGVTTSTGTGSVVLSTNPALSGASVSGNLGINNTSPIAPLTVGDASSSSCDGYIVLEYHTGSNNRQYRIGVNSNSDLQFGDYGYSNVAGTWVNNFSFSYASPANSFYLNQYGDVILGFNLYVYGIISGNASRISAINASNVSSGTLAVTQGGTGATSTTGTGSNVLNANPTIAGTLTCSSNVIINGGSSSGAKLDTGLINITNGVGLAVPSVGTIGGTGDKLILWPGDATHHPYALGMNGGVLWYSVPNTAYHVFYVNGTNTMQIGSSGLSVNTGVITGSGSGLLALNASNITSGTLSVSQGGTGTTTSTGTGSVVLSTNPTISGLTLSGSINATNLNSASYVYSSSTSTAAPTTGTTGGSGDRLILYQGGTCVYPYSLGINSGTMWYSVPTGTSHNFFVGGTSNLTITSGNVGIQNTSPIAPLTIGNASSTCDGYLVLEKNNGSGLNRMFRLGLNSNSDFQIGDYGYSNIAGTWVNIFSMSWAAPANSFYLNQYGNIVLGNALSVAGATTCSSTLTITGVTYCNSNLIVGGAVSITGTNSYYQIGSNNYFALASTSGFYSSSSVANDIIFQGGNNVLLQSGSGAAAIKIDTSNNINMLNSTTFSSPILTTAQNSIISYYNPNPTGNTNGVSNGAQFSLCAGATTSLNNMQPYLTVACADSWNGTDNIVRLLSSGGANSGTNFGTSIQLDSSYATNHGYGNYSGTISFFAGAGSSTYTQMLTMYSTSTTGTNSYAYFVAIGIFANNLSVNGIFTNTSDETLKSNIETIIDLSDILF